MKLSSSFNMNTPCNRIPSYLKKVACPPTPCKGVHSVSTLKTHQIRKIKPTSINHNHRNNSDIFSTEQSKSKQNVNDEKNVNEICQKNNDDQVVKKMNDLFLEQGDVNNNYKIETLGNPLVYNVKVIDKIEKKNYKIFPSEEGDGISESYLSSSKNVTNETKRSEKELTKHHVVHHYNKNQKQIGSVSQPVKSRSANAQKVKWVQICNKCNESWTIKDLGYAFSETDMMKLNEAIESCTE